FESGNSLADGGNVRHGLVASLLHYRQDPDLAGRQVGNGGRKAQECHLDVAAEQIVDSGAAAAIRHVDDVDPGFLARELAGEVVRGGGAGRAVVELAGIGSGIGDHVRDGLGGKVGMDRKADDVRPGIDDGREVLYRVERDVLVEVHVAGHHRV